MFGGIVMNRPFTLSEGVDSWNTIIFLYRSALKEVGTKVEILNDEFQQVHRYNPIEYIKSRIKTPESIVKKLKRNGYESSIENMVNHVNDIAGIRIVCSFTSDIYRLTEMIGRQNDLTVLSVKDYIRHPKESGYKSYHMLVTVPIFLSDRIIDSDTDDGDGFLGKSGAQDLLQVRGECAGIYQSGSAGMLRHRLDAGREDAAAE